MAITKLRSRDIVYAIVFLLAVIVFASVTGPAQLSISQVFAAIAVHLPILSRHFHVSSLDEALVWQLIMPRICLGLLVGAMLAGAGAAYQGVFLNPLADPYLLGVASGAGLGATIVLIFMPEALSWSFNPLPLAAFVGGVISVTLTFILGKAAGSGRNSSSLLLAGIAIAAFFTAAQTFLQQRSSQGQIQDVYSWILGSLATAGWSNVVLILPYVAIAAIILVSMRRLLDALAVGDFESQSFGLKASTVRGIVIVAATLGTAAAVSVSGLIGFVGIIVPHMIRLITGSSYKRIMPLSILYGGAFLVLADYLARTILYPEEIPLGVVTAFLGAPFFLIVLRTSKRLI